MFENDIARLDLALSDTGLSDEQKAILLSRKQAKVYQKQYQEALEGQLNNIMYNLCFEGYETINQYLTESYDNAFIGELYNLQQQGVPIIVPIDQKAAVRAILTNSKLSAGLYAKLGIDLMQMKTDITREVTRGIAKGVLYKDMARNLKNVSGVSLSKAKTIVRTEGHRIQEASRNDAQHRAKDIGADVVKQWDSYLDGKTRESHMKMHGEIQEIDKKFSNGLMYPGDSSGKAEEVINCRCRSNTRARWALSANETKMLGNVKEMSPKRKQEIADKLHVPVEELDKYSEQIVPINAKNYEDFKRQYKEYWHYEGSDLQKEAEARIAGYKTGKKSGNTGNNSSKPLENSAKSGKIKGAISGAYNNKNDPEGLKREAHAETYYEALRNSNKKDVVDTIAQNTNIEATKVSKMFDHLFVNKYDLGGRMSSFDPDYYIAESVQRLRDGKNIQEHDLILVNHESLEHELMNKKGMNYEQAHRIANESFNYREALDKWLDENEK